MLLLSEPAVEEVKEVPTAKMILTAKATPELEERVYNYVIEHEGTIALSQAAKDLGISLEELSVSAGKAANASLVVDPEPTSYGIHNLNLTAESGSITHNLRFTVVVPSFEIVSVKPSAILSVSGTSARTATVAIAFRSLWGDIGVITWSPPTLKGSVKPPELPYGVLPARNASEIYQGKDEVKHVAFSFSVSPDTPSGSYEIVLSVYAASCPVCRKELILTLRVT